MQQARAPFVDDSLRIFLAAAKMETGNKPWAVVIHRSQGKEGVLGVELFDVSQRLRGRIGFRQVRQRLAQKILDGRFAVKLIHIAVIPFIESSIEIRHVCQKKCSLRQKGADGAARTCFRSAPIVPARERGDGERYDH